jgi:hypothetical protein
MPYKSEAQRRFMHAQHPDIAERWDKEYSSTHLPERAPKRTRARRREVIRRRAASQA